MNITTNRTKRITRHLIAVCLLFSPFVLKQGEIYSQKKVEKPFSCEEILKLLNSKLDQKQIIQQIKKIRVDCNLDAKTIRKLVIAGASESLVEAMEKYQAKDREIIIITSPKAGEEVGATIKVEGKSKIVEGNYLWIFAHREGLNIWWPQGGTVALKKNGEWRQGVYLGGPQDIGFDFEIKAIWVDKKENQKLNDYLAKGSATGSYPGIVLPEGSPSVDITVHKVRH